MDVVKLRWKWLEPKQFQSTRIRTNLYVVRKITVTRQFLFYIKLSITLIKILDLVQIRDFSTQNEFV